ncbi:transporter [Ureibacillus massiliensis 4400831 = CIP 108448 = CCUG 49529]|uniref:Transporter n=1 Tax=Ureibacillus massiliensis 4400831 = CIP 108448 = CCUG 49529 TaxID=1211035 RepID=A0A0A3J987_9BACL|nr:EamA family transporter [Ureibacillus massiliensis]KGR91733.1 transporter [Ureibacillus massiliensis 4400831 = CIP 108448 = CCUG 49529]
MKDKLSPFLILLAAILWGTTGTTQAFAPETAHPIAIGATRLAVGGLFLIVVVLIIGKFDFKNWPIKTTILASLSMALYQPLFFSAVSITGVAVGTVVAIGSAPILSGIIEWLYLKVRPSKVWWCSTFLSILGCLMLFSNKESVNVDPFGILMALGAGLSFAGYTLISRTLVEKHSSISVVAIVFTLSAIWLSPLLFIFDMSWIMSLQGVGVSLQLGIMATGIAYLLFARGLKNVSSSTAVTLALAEPLTAALLGVFLLEETLNITSWIGIFLLLLGIGILMWTPKKSDSENEIMLAQKE